jgi:hypothetical protein
MSIERIFALPLMIRKYQEQLEKIDELKPQLKSKGFIDDAKIGTNGNRNK